ncbi:Origin recognition complex subunit 1 [Babesia sp. Xinjiang]|uniref:Origin recognition complex subunit 1 n=1 Tax=Babesia sp. Xinjiang TaxID=462227 RepID=UPI000A2342E0|nr:Origin recognition complex subunit 1 [Babesia sp. Xinjiang]ORM41291.1 Origin recognition complex subunit 1 [Babesia sp. Xinjiang]
MEDGLFSDECCDEQSNQVSAVDSPNTSKNADKPTVNNVENGESTAIECGNVVVEVDGKKFYRSIKKGVDLIQVGDSVDVVVRFLGQEKRVTRLAKIAAIFQDNTGELNAEVSYYYDSDDKIPGFHKRQLAKEPKSDEQNSSEWAGFTHKNEVVASNEFECITADAIDDLITVHGSLRDYEAAVAGAEDEYGHVFCNTMFYVESYALKPFNVELQWKKVMLERSQYHRIYHMGFTEDDNGDTQHTGNLGRGHVIIGRETEANRIRTFIETGIRQGGTGQLLYVSGVPGTGKSATINMIVRELSEKKLSAKLPWFHLIEINGVNLMDPNDFYRCLYTKLFNKPSPYHVTAYKQLDAYFWNNKTPCVLIVDEADYIVTRRQKVLFTIFDWPSRKSSKLVVVIVSNTMDLPSRMKASCVSRLAFGTLVFQPYRYQQILDVLSANEEIASRIDDVALQLCARRVTNYSGDMRKALQICKLAVALADGENVTTAEMNRVSNMVLSSEVIESLRYSSRAMSCFLVAMVLELRETQLSVACARTVYDGFRGMMAVMNPEMTETVSIESYRKLLVSASISGIISLEPTVFTSLSASRKVKVNSYINEELGDTGIVPEVDVGQIITALSRDPYWEQKLRDMR